MKKYRLLCDVRVGGHASNIIFLKNQTFNIPDKDDGHFIQSEVPLFATNGNFHNLWVTIKLPKSLFEEIKEQSCGDCKFFKLLKNTPEETFMTPSGICIYPLPCTITKQGMETMATRKDCLTFKRKEPCDE